MSNSKIVFITGATAGIGRTTALHLARLGHHVIASGRKAAELAKLATEALDQLHGQGGKLDVVPLDVTSAESIAGAVEAVASLTDGNGPDVLINNAGFGVLGPTSEISEAEMRRLAAEAQRRWPIRKVAMMHRLGLVPVGQASVGIAVSAGHRAEAFAACHWLIDRLKEIVPIWKREHFHGGRVWIGAQQGGPAPPKKRVPRRTDR